MKYLRCFFNPMTAALVSYFKDLLPFPTKLLPIRCPPFFIACLTRYLLLALPQINLTVHLLFVFSLLTFMMKTIPH